MTSAAGPSVHVQRARKLLYGGLAGGLLAAVACLVVFALLDGAPGLASAALGAGCVLFFYVVGQLVMVAFADAGARTLLAADQPCLFAGDYNVCPADEDLAPGVLPPTDALVRPETRARFRAMLWLGLTDAIRAITPSGPAYTF